MHLVGSLVVLVSLLCAVYAQTPCRRSESVTRCVEAPMSPPPDESVQLCSYRVCAFSFITAIKCDANLDLRATHVCSKEESFVPKWRCEPGKEHRMVKVPVGCQGDKCTDEIRACPCVGFVAKRTVLEPATLMQTSCETVKVTK